MPCSPLRPQNGTGSPRSATAQAPSTRTSGARYRQSSAPSSSPFSRDPLAPLRKSAPNSQISLPIPASRAEVPTSTTAPGRSLSRVSSLTPPANSNCSQQAWRSPPKRWTRIEGATPQGRQDDSQVQAADIALGARSQTAAEDRTRPTSGGYQVPTRNRRTVMWQDWDVSGLGCLRTVMSQNIGNEIAHRLPTLVGKRPKPYVTVVTLYP